MNPYGIFFARGTFCRGQVSDLIANGMEYSRYGSDLHVINLSNRHLLTIKDWVNGNLCINFDGTIETKCGPPPPPTPWPPPKDPHVLDLDGNGIQFTAIENSTAYYDFSGSGFAIKTGWIGPADGFLVEGQGNGNITLFGNPAQDGFADFARFDNNGDGIVSRKPPLLLPRCYPQRFSGPLSGLSSHRTQPDRPDQTQSDCG